jgi:hypothetical protein
MDRVEYLGAGKFTVTRELILGFFLRTAAMAVAVILMGSYSLWSQEAAGWAQAIGTAVAVVSAVWIAGSQDRKTQRRNAEQQIKKAKSVVACFVPILQTIRYDVHELIGLTRHAQEEMPTDAIKASGYHFRELPHYVSFVLGTPICSPATQL